MTSALLLWHWIWGAAPLKWRLPPIIPKLWYEMNCCFDFWHEIVKSFSFNKIKLNFELSWGPVVVMTYMFRALNTTCVDRSMILNPCQRSISCQIQYRLWFTLLWIVCIIESSVILNDRLGLQMVLSSNETSKESLNTYTPTPISDSVWCLPVRGYYCKAVTHK